MTPEQIHDALNLLPSDLITEADKLRNPKKKFLVFRPWVATAACAVLVLLIGSFTAQNFLPSMHKSAESIAEAPAAEAPNTAAPMDIPAEIQEAAMDMESILMTPTGEPEPTAEEAYDEMGRGENSIFTDAAIDLTGIQYISTPVRPGNNIPGDPRTSLVTSAGALYDYYVKYCEIFYMDDYFAATASYDREWFQENDLLILRIGAPHPEFHYDVTGFWQHQNTDPPAWQINLKRNPDEPTDVAFDNNSMWHILIPLPKGILPKEATILIDFA